MALRIALIGCGSMGKRWASAIAAYESATLEAIIDREKSIAEETARKYGAKAFSAIEEMPREVRPDACIIATPHQFLAPLAKRAIEMGMHVLSEKPGAKRPEEMREVVELAREKDLRFMIGYNYRFFPSLLKAKEIVDAGKVGDIMFIRARHGFGGRPGYDMNWRHKREISGGGELIDQGSHLIDLARWFLGDISDSRGFLEDAFWKTGVEDNAFLLLKSSEGKVASLHASWTQWAPLFSFEIYGTKGVVEIQGLGRKYGDGERVVIRERKDDFSSVEEKVIECDPDADKALTRELEEFSRAIYEKRDPQPSGRDALAVLEIIADIYGKDQ